MDEKTKELIAIGAAVAANCQPCVEFHLQKAKAVGAEERELVMAAKVGLQVKAGAAEKSEAHVADLLSSFKQQSVASVCDCG